MKGAKPDPNRRERERPPGGFFYDRVMPWLLVALGLALAAVVLLSVAALLGLFPTD